MINTDFVNKIEKNNFGVGSLNPSGFRADAVFCCFCYFAGNTQSGEKADFCKNVLLPLDFRYGVMI